MSILRIKNKQPVFYADLTLVGFNRLMENSRANMEAGLLITRSYGKLNPIGRAVDWLVMYEEAYYSLENFLEKMKEKK